MDRKLFDSVFCGDSILIIAKFLEPKDIVTICRMFKRTRYNLYPIYTVSVMRTIDDWFRSYFGQTYDKFREAMVADKAIVTGSFILQMILGERWTGSDVDIFISLEHWYSKYRNDRQPHEYYTEVEKFIYNEPDIPEKERDGRLGGTCGRYINAFGKEGAIAQIRNYGIDTTKDSNFDMFQIIEVLQTTDIIGFIEHTFDFDLCKNTFYYDEQGMHLDILNINEILNRRIGFKPCYDLVSSLERCKKYTARGFKFTDALDFATHYHAGARAAFNKLLTELASKYCKEITVEQ